MWANLLAFWRSLLSIGSASGAIYAILVLPKRIPVVLDSYPIVRDMLTPEVGLIALGIVFVVYVFSVDLRRYLDVTKWLTTDDAARYFRDLLVRNHMQDGVNMFDTMISSARTRNPLVWAFRFYIEQGINDGQLNVWGTPENGYEEVKIPPRVKDDSTNYGPHELHSDFDPDFLCVDGVKHRRLRVRKSDIKSYVTHIRKHDAKLKRRSVEQED